MTGPLLHGRQTCSLIPVGVEADLTAPTPRHRARRAEDPPTMWTPPGGKRRAELDPTPEDRPMQTNNPDAD